MVFDFGSEMYIWSGKFAPVERRKKAMDLAKDLWNAEYDYTECDINPIYQRVTSRKGVFIRYFLKLLKYLIVK